MMRPFWKRIVLCAGLLLVSSVPASAVTVELPDGFVGHTRRLPVIVHRIFPPYLGQHVYLRPVPPKRGPYAFAPMPAPVFVSPYGPAGFAW
jgi:hypothetical protein